MEKVGKEEILKIAKCGSNEKFDSLFCCKVIRSLTGHKSGVSTCQFHPYGEFFMSGAEDGTIKIWDIRKRGCIQTHQASPNTNSKMSLTIHCIEVIILYMKSINVEYLKQFSKRYRQMVVGVYQAMPQINYCYGI